MGGCQHLLAAWVDSYPCRAFGLLTEKMALIASKIIADPDCLYDEILAALVRMFPTEAALMSKDLDLSSQLSYINPSIEP